MQKIEKNLKSTVVVMVDLEFFRLKLEQVLDPILKSFRVPLTQTKRVLSDKLVLKVALVSVLSVMVLFNSFSWFYSEYIGPGFVFNTGRIEHTINQYDNGGVLLEEVEGTGTIIFEPNMGITTKNSKFIEVRNDGTLDMDYNITFQLDGTIAEAGVMYYRLYEVTNEVNAAITSTENPTKLEAYAAANPIDPAIESDSVRPIANMSTIGNLVRKDSIKITGDTPDLNPKYYRLDYGMYANANSTLYADKTISVHMNVYSTQYGQLSEDTTSEQTWLVVNQSEFRDAMNAALPGNTIKLMEDITIDGTVNFNKRIHLNTNQKTLTVTGDLVYDFVEFGNLVLSTIGSGKIEIDGNLVVNTPKTEVNFVGSNDIYDIYVGGTTTLNGIQDGEKDGVLLETVRIVDNKTLSTPEDLIIMSNTRLNVGSDVIVGNVVAQNGAANIEIINSGTIKQVQLQAMTLMSTFTKAQIYIYNLGNITGTESGASILLPTNATPYLGPNIGNTLIVKGITSSDITVSGSSTYTQDDIIYDNSDNSVIPIEGEVDAYTVYIKEADRHLDNILSSYFIGKGEVDVAGKIAAIKKLVIHTINAQYMVNADFDYLKSSDLSALAYLDIANARVRDGDILNKIKNDALSGKATLTTVILPKTVTIIGDNAFYNVALGVIPANITDAFNILKIPASVTTIGQNAFNMAKYVEFEGAAIPTLTSTTFDISNGGTKIFVTETSIPLFQANPNINAINVHQIGFLSDDRQFFVYDYEGGLGISLFLGSSNVGTSLGIPSEININTYPTAVKAVGTSAYRHVTTSVEGATLSLPNTLVRIDGWAFYNLNLTSANLNNLTTIGKYAFYNNKFATIIANNAITVGDYAFTNSTAAIASFDSLTNLGAYALASATNLYEIKLDSVKIIGESALYDCKNLSRVYFGNTASKFVNNAEVIDISIGNNAIFSNWGYYVDDRLRVYVPDGSSINGNSYLSLYKNLFGENARYTYVTGESVNDYYHFAVPYNLTQYTVRQVTVLDYLNNSTDGWEIISYQGADLTSAYQFPEELTVNSVTLPVVSIGVGAYKNVAVTTGQAPTISSTELLKINDNAFEGINIASVNLANVVTIGEKAFYQSGLKTATFTNLKTIAQSSFENSANLWSLNLGNVSSLGSLSISNLANLQRIYFANTSMDLTFPADAMTNVATNTGSRFRIYVPATDANIAYYKGLTTYSDHVYATGSIVGSYTLGGQEIGQYSVRQVTKNNYSGTPVNGYEIVEYHGANLTSDYVIPTALTASSVTLPVISIGREAYLNTDVVAGNNFVISNDTLIEVGLKAFYDVDGITSLTANSITTIGASAFAKTDLNYVVLNNLKTLSSLAFADMASLYSINLGTVTSMSLNSVYNANYLEQVFFEANTLTVSFNADAFSNVGSLTNDRLRFYVTDANASSGNPYFKEYRALFSEDYRPYFYPKGSIVGSYEQPGIPYDIGSYSVRVVTINDKTATPITGFELIEYHGADLTSSYDIPSSVTVGPMTYSIISIGDNAFVHTNSVASTKINITSLDLLKIGEKAFYDFVGLETFIADNVLNIGNEAFRNNSTQKYSFASLQNTGNYAMAGNTQLYSINLGSIIAMGDGLLYGNNNVEQMFFTSTNRSATTMNITIGTDALYNVGTAIGHRLRIYVPNGIATGTTTYVDLYKNTLPSTIAPYIYGTGEIVGSYVHSVLPYNIGEYSIKEVIVNSITGWEIIEYHGADLTGSYTIPTSFTVGETNYPVISIGPRAYVFAELTGGLPLNLVLPDSVIYIGDYAFQGRQLSSLTGATMFYVGKYAFQNSPLLTTVTFNGVTTIGEYAFEGNDSMSTVSIGAGVVTIGNYAFYNTTIDNALTDFYINTMVPPTITTTTFPAIGTALKVYVPYDAWSTYRTTSVWSGFNVIRTQTAYLGLYLYNIINTNEIQITKFQGNNNTIVIPDVFTLDGVDHQVTSIASGTFDIAGNLRDVTLPQYLNHIGDGVLGTNASVRNIYVHANNQFFSSISGVLFDKLGEVMLAYPNNRTDQIYTLPTSTKVINAYAFYNAPSLRTLNLNANLLVLSYNSFVSCSSLKTFTFASLTPPYITGLNVFPVRTDLRINVPTASYNLYRNKFTLYKYRSYIVAQ